MRRFFFHLRHAPGPDGLARDPEGDALPGPGEARAHALAIARGLIARTRVHAVRDWFACTFEVTDEDDRPVMAVPFSDTVMADED
ncbi:MULTISPECIES: hypothetical protein [Methylobacterium]|jgi:hypothetical protein|uniref:DUF6894 family protein n=1 Tax=Methylobacterium TaxID=407 RepID=UPI0008E0E6A5|nr:MULTISPECIES: hypothetical protein [Methylobacterium]MBZ6415214.1 hypothetical protein [Methylobacterium sp.]MBK3397424.1 hypothetical protein [Methylobacterium ajmalii]MBK3412326.1 hypothetical protein [Methylobacterium ajmalii]MBK3421311.1 hypothetical protein [Methylobacterium ajmalii]SFF73982.1 hypothetical protein SAMN04487844_14420 [Methylobacterium sp. yr596]